MTTEEQWTVRRVLDWTINYLKEHGSENARLDAEILLAHARKCQRILLYTQFDQVLSEHERSVMRALVKRRAAAEPVAYLVGYREFFSLNFEVKPGVFIPRPETETLVALTLDLIKVLQQPKVLELCTGSGCVPIAIAKNHRSVDVTTVEKNPIPFEVASRNIAKHQAEQRVHLLRGNLFEPISDEMKFDVIVSNPPYVTTAEIGQLQADVALHEPHEALDGGADGLDIIRIIIDQSRSYLNDGGRLLFELDPGQTSAAIEFMQENGYQHVRSEADLSGNGRIVLGSYFHK